MKVEQLMTLEVVSVEQNDQLSLVKEIFAKRKFHHLLVVEDNKLIGVLSDRDLFKALSPNLGTTEETSEDIDSLRKRVKDIMSHKLFVLQTDSNIYDAIDLFNNQNISCIPIVDDEYRPVGILTWRDILRELSKKKK